MMQNEYGVGGTYGGRATNTTEKPSMNDPASGDKQDVKPCLVENSLLPKNDVYTSSKPSQQSPYDKSKPASVKRPQVPSNIHQHNAFSHMMKQSAKVFKCEHELTVKHKFHLHYDQDGRITTTWIPDQTDATIAMENIVWSTNVTVRKIKSVSLHPTGELLDQEHDKDPEMQSQRDATTLELNVSSSIPFQQNQQVMQGDTANNPKFNFVQQHSRLSVCRKHY
jgi:hypothetical protein